MAVTAPASVDQLLTDFHHAVEEGEAEWDSPEGLLVKIAAELRYGVARGLHFLIQGDTEAARSALRVALERADEEVLS